MGFKGPNVNYKSSFNRSSWIYECSKGLDLVQVGCYLQVRELEHLEPWLRFLQLLFLPTIHYQLPNLDTTYDIAGGKAN
jgi:hypothetical protein